MTVLSNEHLQCVMMVKKMGVGPEEQTSAVVKVSDPRIQYSTLVLIISLYYTEETSGVGEILRSFAICYKNGKSGHDSGELEKWGVGDELFLRLTVC